MEHGQGRPAGRAAHEDGAAAVQHGKGQPVAVVSALIAAAYLGVTVAAPRLLLAIVPVILVLACGLTTRLRARREMLWGIGLWLAVGVGGAWWWRAEPANGLVWVVGVLFLVPLPLIPWLFAVTFEDSP